MRLLWMLLIALNLTACARDLSRTMTIEGLGPVERLNPSYPGYESDGSLRCADLKKPGCVVTCGERLRARGIRSLVDRS